MVTGYVNKNSGAFVPRSVNCFIGWICLFCLLTACAKENKPDTLTLDAETLILHTYEQGTLNAFDQTGEKIANNAIEWTSSDPQTVAIDRWGVIEAKRTGNVLIKAVYNNQMTTCNVTVEPNVYLAGFIQSGNDRVAAYWKNGQAVFLNDPKSSTSDAWSIFVDQCDVYVAGSVFDGASSKAICWKNGMVMPLKCNTSRSGAYSVFVENGAVFVAGYDGESAQYWKNGVPVILADKGKAKAIHVVNENIYVAGERNGTGIYWKDGQEFELPTDGSAYVNAIFVSNNDIYIAGQVVIPNKKPIAQYWKNGTSVALTDGNNEADLTGIWVDNHDVYAVGSEQYLTGNVPVYWKNGIAVMLEGQGGGYGIAVNNGEVFVGGYENRSETFTSAKYWQNGKGIYVTNNGGNVAVGTSIFVD